MLKNNKKSIKILLIVLLLLFTGCSSAKISKKERNERVLKISNFYKDWKGTKYKFSGETKRGVDCSGLVQILYREKFEIELPRTTKTMVVKGVRIKERDEWEVGDLVFFKIGRRKTRHVGVYLGNNRFLHSSTSRGVIISELDSYWNKNLWQVRRILK
ncbi:MAG: C40 family peptidase [Cetobacterium sp.]